MIASEGGGRMLRRGPGRRVGRCRECRESKALVARGLCKRCYRLPAVREKYPLAEAVDPASACVGCAKEPRLPGRLIGPACARDRLKKHHLPAKG